MKRYKLTAKDTLVDTKSDQTFVYTKVRAEKKPTCTMVHFRLNDGKEKSLALHTIDTSEHDLGLGAVEVKPKHLERLGSKADPLKMHVDVNVSQVNGGVIFQKAELLEIHTAFQSAADLTLKKLVELIR